MKVTLELSESLVREILDYSDDELVLFEDAAAALLLEAVQGKKLTDLDEDELNETVEQMLNFALNNTDEDKVFKTNELYVRAFNEKWTKLSSSTRKSIGRRFRNAVTEHADEANYGDTIIKFDGRNINNAAVYRVDQK